MKLGDAASRPALAMNGANKLSPPFGWPSPIAGVL